MTLTCEYQLALEYQLEDFDGISETKLHHSYCLSDLGDGGCAVREVRDEGKGFSESCEGKQEEKLE